MKRVTQLFTAALLACGWANAAFADAINITFEQPPCAALSPGIYPGDCYLASGVLLSSTINFDRRVGQTFSIAPDTHAVSAPNVARASTSFLDVRGDFVAAGGAPGFTDFISWNVTGSVPGQDPWAAILFDANGLVLAQTLAFSDQLVSFSRPQADIRSFFMSIGTIAQGMDNLTFDTPQSRSLSPTPDPSAVVMLGIGLAVLFRWRFARFNHSSHELEPPATA